MNNASNLMILPPATIFMSRGLSNEDEDLHIVPKDRDSFDPFFIFKAFESDERIYWIGGDEVEYSVFKEDVIYLRPGAYHF